MTSGQRRPSGRLDLQSTLRDPASAFAEPQDVLGHPGLTEEQKRLILQQWERDARGLAVAEEEGMGGGEESLLSRVQRALSHLGARPAEGRAGTKHG